MKAIILARVSTAKQSYDEQVNDLIALAIKDGYTKKQIKVIKNKESGIKLDEEHRLGLIELKETIKNDASINAVYIRSIDRIGRREEVNLSIKNFLIDRKIQLVVKTPELRLLNDDGKVNSGAELAFSLFNTMAKQEMEIKKDRFAQGRREALKQGKVISKVCLGYKTDNNNHIIVDDSKVDIIRYIFNTYANTNASCFDIYKELSDRGEIKKYALKETGVAIIYKILSNPAYIGEKATRNVKVNYKYPAIVSDEVFEKANIKLKQMKQQPKHNSKHILYAKGIITCSCGHKMQGELSTYLAYKCRFCKSVISVNVIDYIAFEKAKEIKANQVNSEPTALKEHYSEEININLQKIDVAKKSLSKIDKALERAYNGYVRGKIKENIFDNTTASLNQEKKSYETTIVNLENKNNYLNTLIQNIEEYEDGEVYDNMNNLASDEEKRRIIQDTISNIKLTKTDDGTVIEIINKDGHSIPDKYLYKQSTHPKVYWMYGFNVNDLHMYKEITKDITKRFKKNRYGKK